LNAKCARIGKHSSFELDLRTNFDRYHGKCLKIARGKVKGSETFTCPICDWRVKIPRDAARPKLEDLQQWAEELPSLPFQPDEEDILERIVDKAQNFRDFLQQFINGNQICRTSEEMPTILFYLRKIEGAEVLLAYETNIFRQDVHKWQPIAPEPPPILEQSLSTRKPRPTKQQKMMKELGVAKVEDLPPHMRKLSTVKRKNTEPQVGRPAPPPLQPAQMQRQGSGPNPQMMRSDTPVGMPRQASTGNAPNNPGFDGGMSFSHGFGTSASSSYQSPHHTASPTMFSPTTSLPSNNGMREAILGPAFSGGAIASTTGADSSPALFSPGYAMGSDDDIRTGIMGSTTNGTANHHNGVAPGDGVNGHADAPPDLGSSPHATNVDEMFMEMTNEEPDREEHLIERRDGVGILADGDTGRGSMPPTTLEHHTSQASEALEMIRSASDGAGESGDGDAVDEVADGVEDGAGAFDEFLNGVDA
jgi:[histone H3]-trimethyl-L-lysine4 demethylase